MFRSKKRVASNPQQQQPQANYVAPSAASAAALAFLKKQGDDQALSSSAAAAALRSYTTSPAPVSEVQTKRMVRRNSNSSLGSATGSVSGRQPFSSNMQRRGSSGSMSQRSFRSPSPSSAGNAALAMSVAPEDVPPVPKPPQKYLNQADVPARVASPARNHSLPPRTTSRTKPDLQNISTAQIPGESTAFGQTSPRNINFSRPMSPPLVPPPQANTSAKKVAGPPVAQPRTTRARPASSLGFTQPNVAANGTQRANSTRLQTHPDMRNVQSQNVNANESAKAGAALNAAYLAARPATSSQSNAAAPARANTVGSRPATRPAQRPMSMIDSYPIEDVTEESRPFTGVDMSTRRIIPGAWPGTTQKAQPSRTGLVTRSDEGTDVAKQQRTTPHTGYAQPQNQPSFAASHPIPNPSDEQIRKFQTRAAALLARPSYAEPTANPEATVPPPNLAALRAAGQEPVADRTHMAHARDNEKRIEPAQPKAVAEAKQSAAMQRQPSVSPARSAHFSESLVTSATKHTPPVRALSPAKSAMKSSSPRTASPDPHVHAKDGSEMSTDSRDYGDEDGSSPSERKKKTTHVSFEERPVLVGEAAGIVGSPVDAPLSPQYKNMSAADNDGMGPRPVLPSFGSVRGRRDVEDNTVDVADEDEEPHVVEQGSAGQAPEIEVHPASPYLERDQEPRMSHDLELSHNEAAPNVDEALTAADVKDVVYSHPKQLDEEPQDNRAPLNTGIDQSNIRNSVQSIDSNESDDVYADAQEENGDASTAAGFASLDAIIESPGESPNRNEVETIGQAQTADTVMHADPHPEIDETHIEDTEQPQPDDWNAVTSYWTSLSEEKRAELEQTASPTVAEFPNAVPSATVAKANGVATEAAPPLPPGPNEEHRRSIQPRKSAMKKPSTPVKAPIASQPVASQPTASQSKPMRQSMRGTQAAAPPIQSEEVHMRKSMRNSGALQSSMRSTYEPPRMRQVKMSEETARLHRQAKQGQTSRPAQKDQASAEAIALARSAMQLSMAKDSPKHIRQASYDSDGSETSFRRGRRGTKGSEDAPSVLSMRRSMRSGPPSDYRPSSPPVAPSSPPVRTLRGNAEPAKRESKLFGLGGKSKTKADKSRGFKEKSRFSSRFGDSSDDDSDTGAGPARPSFRSRIVDSDSDDMDFERSPPKKNKPKLTPVRGIPRRAGQEEGDSTDLSDSDEEARVPKGRPSTPPTGVLFGRVSGESRAVNGTEGKVLGSGTLRGSKANTEEHEKTSKRNIFGFGGKKKADKGAFVASTPEDVNAAIPEEADDVSKPSQDNATTDPPSTPPPQNMPTIPKTLRADDVRQEQQRSPSPAPSQSRRSRFLRRLSISSAPEKDTKTEEFPFPPPPIPNEYKESAAADSKFRPNTSEGTASSAPSQRPPLGSKRNSSMTAPVGANAVGAGNKLRKVREPTQPEKPAKKKKFQGLRKAFGLKD